MATSFLKRLFVSPLIGYRWSKAIELASRQDYEAAVGVLRTIEGYLVDRSAEFHLLKGFLSFATSEPQLTIENIEVAIPLIKKNKRYNDDEKRYLMCYASTWTQKAQEYTSRATNDPQDENYGDFDLSNVRPALKRNFPLRGHQKCSSEP